MENLLNQKVAQRHGIAVRRHSTSHIDAYTPQFVQNVKRIPHRTAHAKMTESVTANQGIYARIMENRASTPMPEKLQERIYGKQKVSGNSENIFQRVLKKEHRLKKILDAEKIRNALNKVTPNLVDQNIFTTDLSKFRIPVSIILLALTTSMLIYIGWQSYTNYFYPYPPNVILLPEKPTVITDELVNFITPDLSNDNELDGDTTQTLPFTQELKLTDYTVIANDSIEKVAKKTGLRVGTIVSINELRNQRDFRVGLNLKIPNADGLMHRVKRGESIGSIARRYRLSENEILDANNLRSAVIQSGDKLFIPGARLPNYDLQQFYGTLFQWPIRGRITSYFGTRPDPFTGVPSFHRGLDIAAPTGAPIRAVMDGVVDEAGYSRIYGNYVIIKHANGYRSLYGHMTRYVVSQGLTLRQGSVIGYVGATGYATGPHCHLSIFHNGKDVNPLSVLSK